MATVSKIIAATVASSVVVWFMSRKISKRKRLPPGPPLLVGNTLEAPRVRPWLAYSAWADQYGMPTGPLCNTSHPTCLTTLQVILSISKLLAGI